MEPLILTEKTAQIPHSARHAHTPMQYVGKFEQLKLCLPQGTLKLWQAKAAENVVGNTGKTVLLPTIICVVDSSNNLHGQQRLLLLLWLLLYNLQRERSKTRRSRSSKNNNKGISNMLQRASSWWSSPFSCPNTSASTAVNFKCSCCRCCCQSLAKANVATVWHTHTDTHCCTRTCSL